MVRFLSDEDFNGIVVRGLIRWDSAIDLIRVQDVGLRTKTDAHVLEWAALHGRVVLTHDVGSMPAAAFARVTAGLPMPGMAVVSQRLSVRQAIEQIRAAAYATTEAEWQDRVLYLRPQI